MSARPRRPFRCDAASASGPMPGPSSRIAMSTTSLLCADADLGPTAWRVADDVVEGQAGDPVGGRHERPAAGPPTRPAVGDGTETSTSERSSSRSASHSSAGTSPPTSSWTACWAAARASTSLKDIAQGRRQRPADRRAPPPPEPVECRHHLGMEVAGEPRALIEDGPMSPIAARRKLVGERPRPREARPPNAVGVYLAASRRSPAGRGQRVADQADKGEDRGDVTRNGQVTIVRLEATFGRRPPGLATIQGAAQRDDVPPKQRQRPSDRSRRPGRRVGPGCARPSNADRKTAIDHHRQVVTSAGGWLGPGPGRPGRRSWGWRGR